MLLAGIAVLCASGALAQESVYQGAFPGGSGSPTNAASFEASSGKGLSIINFFINWDNSGGNVAFPTSTMDYIRNRGSMPLLTWQPAGASADAAYKLSNIAAGNFDAFIQQWALDARTWGHPFFLRFAHEMNGSWYPWGAGVNGNTSADYVAAWRHVHDLFVRNGVTNVTWVWCVNTPYSGSAAIEGLYPGDNYVDWTSLDSYNRITNTWADFSGRSQSTLDALIALAPGKPIMVAEAGCHEDDVQDKGQWFRNAMAYYLKTAMPRVKAWCYFNGNNPDGNDWRITTSSGALAGYQYSVGLSYYSDNKYGAITASPIPPLVNDATAIDAMGPFVSIVTPAIGTVQAGVTTELRASASDKAGVSKVEYYVNGTLARTAQSGPYQYSWPVPSGAGATYAVVAKAYDTAGNTVTSTVQFVSKSPPAAPTQVAASDGVFTDKVRVTWASVATALSYEVWRGAANSSAGAVKLNGGPVTGTTYDDATAGYSTAYYYWVKAVDDTGPSAFGSSDTGYRALPPAPATPVGVNATDGVYNDSTLVGWNSVGSATGYEVWRNTTSSTSTATKLTAVPVTGTSYSDTTGVYAQPYYYWVRAVNDGGASPFSVAGSGFRGNLPTISAIAGKTINWNTNTGAIPFTVGDAETAAGSLTLAAGSSNMALVPVANIVFGGSSGSRTVTVTPAANQSGTATITLTVTDADGGQASVALALTVTNGQAAWTALGTASALSWSNGANWSGGIVPVSGLTGLTYFAGSVVPAGAINSSNDLAAPFVLNALTLAGTGPANAAGTVNITGGQLRFSTAGDGTAPTINLAAAVGAGSAALTYNLGLPVLLDTATTFQGDGAAGFFVTGSVSGAGGIVKAGNGTLILAGANTFAGTVTVNAGTLTVSNNAALGTTAGATTVPTAGGQLALVGGITVAEPITLNGRTSGDQLVNMSGGNVLSGPITLQTGGNNYFVRADADKLTLSGSVRMTGSTAGKTLNFSGYGNVEVSGAIGSDAGSLGASKSGTGTLTLSGANSYTGATVVTAGTLVLNSPLTTTSGVSVAAAGTLAGSGTVGAATTVNGTHAPGAGGGTQTFNAALAYGATAHLTWALTANTESGAGMSFTSIRAAGVTVASGAVIDVALNAAGSGANFTDAFWWQGHAWTVLTATSLGGNFTLGTVSNDTAGRVATAYGLFSLQRTSTTVSVVWTPFTPIQAWQYAYFGANWNNPAIAGDNADPDGDGLSNLLEYALGRSPLTANRAGVSVTRGNGSLVLTYPVAKGATDITVQPEWSADLRSWTPQGVTTQVLSDDGTIQTIQATAPLGANTRMFMRLRVTRP